MENNYRAQWLLYDLLKNNSTPMSVVENHACAHTATVQYELLMNGRIES